MKQEKPSCQISLFIESCEAKKTRNPDKKHLISPDCVEYVTHSGWIQTKDGWHLNPLHYEVATDV